MDDVFKKRQSILIEHVLVDGRPADIFVDSGGTIADTGEGIRRKRKGEADVVIDGDGAIALPGLVNTHTHAAMTLLRGYADDMVLQDWLSTKVWPLEAHLTGSDVYWGTKLACLEMIRTGTTAFNDMYFFMDRAAQAADEAGVRAVLSYGFIDLFDPEKRENECRVTEALVSRIRSMNNSRITAAVGPHAIYTVSPEGLRWCADYARDQKIRIHIHLSETKKEVDDCIARHGKRPALHLDDCGILTTRTVAAHGCWLDKAECRLLGQRGVSVSYNPSSNMKLATNRALPYHWLSAAGANVCLGTDGCASNNNLDMLEEVKTAALLQKFYWNDPTLLPAPAALSMATTHGAQALGLGPGTIQRGTPADIILLSARTVCNTPLHNAASNIVYSCSGASVRTTICDGRILMLDARVPGEQEILAGAQKAASDLVRRTAQS
jgi:5-methylthioadenosine/S-adenosylhomocysteine deaminase